MHTPKLSHLLHQLDDRLTEMCQSYHPSDCACKQRDILYVLDDIADRLDRKPLQDREHIHRFALALKHFAKSFQESNKHSPYENDALFQEQYSEILVRIRSILQQLAEQMPLE